MAHIAPVAEERLAPNSSAPVMIAFLLPDGPLLGKQDHDYLLSPAVISSVP